MPIVHIDELLKAQIDYLVVGGGTSGLVVASRLSEDPEVTVAVIEAGSYHKNVEEVDVPGLANKAFNNPLCDWIFLSTPQAHANNQVVYLPRGKGLGGSSLLNLLGLSRGSKADFEALEALGNPGWGWDEIVRYTKRSETLVPLKDNHTCFRAHPSIHHPGPIVKSYSPWYSPLQEPVIQALTTLGVPINFDPANGNNVGTNTGLCTIDPSNATRSYSASAYYEPFSSRPNLLVLTNALVSKVALAQDDDGLQRAIGADLIVDGKTFQLRGVRKEVILSAGTFQTPPILELSGIGNPALLKEHNIPVLVDLPGVGENLQDHTLTFLVMETDSTLEGLDNLRDPAFMQAQRELYKEQKGILASIACQTFSYVPASTVTDQGTIRRWQEETVKNQRLPISLEKQYDIMRPWLANSQEAQFELLALPGHFFRPMSTPELGKKYFSFALSLLHPLSRGSVHIKSTNPEDPPAIDPNYFGHPTDLDMLTEALKFNLKVFDVEPMKSATVAPVLPSKNTIASGGDALKEYVKETVGGEFHPLGTASMLPRVDGGVVDSNLKVYGTSNLRVIDCSILPLEISAHLQSVAYAIGEKVCANSFHVRRVLCIILMIVKGADIIKSAASILL
ncbi:GMC oxidoreductase [Auriscalpium vulgare]|uniref:GMC oxidoreductase n=1 Tax=Auriscalpium vulgare TaxID=40419 RepID=A0ACB8R5W3_9AGAM|nr:GMC oxidoreductase [Auriscalpium vulgare]